MAGLVKAKKFEWKDSNIALFGSDVDRQVKKESADSEPAWQGSGENVGIQIWRIVKFKVAHWPKEDYGKFFGGDSYIILNTYKEDNKDELKYDLHFWIGSESTQDEYGTAAYKTVELDTYHDDKPIQHREVQGLESELFKKYFKEITVMDGGAETGFKHVEPKSYRPRLLRVRSEGKLATTTVREVPLKKAALDSSDVFVLDAGTRAIMWQGKSSNKNEKYKGAQVTNNLKSERSGRITVDTVDEGEISSDAKDFMSFLSDDPMDPDEMAIPLQETSFKKMYRLSDAGGSLEFSLISEADKLMKHDLDSNDVFIVDCGSSVFVWIGGGASESEKRNGMSYAHNYLTTTEHPLIPIHVMKEGNENEDFSQIFS